MTAESVVIVHGLWNPSLATALLARRLRAEGFAAYRFRYRSVSASLAVNAARLAAFIAQVPGERLHLVGHSLGGVLALTMLADNAVARPGRIVCLGSPFGGSRTAQALLRYPGGRRALGESMREALERGAAAEWRGARELGIIAGSMPLGIGRVLTRLPAPHDGTVAVDETRLAGASAHLVLPVSHMALLWSAAVAQEVAAFLRHGRFAREASS